MQAKRYHERISDNPLPRIVTTVTFDRACYFSIPVLVKMAYEYLVTKANAYKIFLYAFAVMPNHVHIIAECAGNKTMGDFMHSYKGALSREIGKWHDQIHDVGTRHPVWQTSFHEKLIYSPDGLFERINYVANNAVKHGIVKNRNEYPWTYVAPEYAYMVRDVNTKGGV